MHICLPSQTLSPLRSGWCGLCGAPAAGSQPALRLPQRRSGERGWLALGMPAGFLEKSPQCGFKVSLGRVQTPWNSAALHLVSILSPCPNLRIGPEQKQDGSGSPRWLSPSWDVGSLVHVVIQTISQKSAVFLGDLPCFYRWGAHRNE